MTGRLQLAKPALDVGLFTNHLEAMLTFWQDTIGIPFVETLKVSPDLTQHRHAVGGSVLKINHARAPLVAALPSGLTALQIAKPSGPLGAHRDPDGNQLTVRPGAAPALTLTITTANMSGMSKFYGDTLGLPAIDPPRSHQRGFQVGESIISLVPGGAVRNPFQQAKGYRYMTFQVFDVKAEHQRILAAGGTEGMAPVKLGEVAHISFVRDPDGNWIEISQRKSITGTLD